MSEFAGNLPRKFISFRHLGFESSAHNLPKERESENPQNVEEVVGASTVKIGETSNSPVRLCPYYKMCQDQVKLECQKKWRRTKK